MAVVGIQNLDQIERKLKKLAQSMGTVALAEAMEAAGEVYRQAIIRATPTGPEKRGKWKRKGHAKNEVIIYEPIQKRSLTEMRRLIGWSKDAFYMFFVDKGWRWSRKRIKRSGTDRAYYSRYTHKQGGVAWGGKTGRARHILASVFSSMSGKAGEAALNVMRKWFDKEAA